MFFILVILDSTVSLCPISIKIEFSSNERIFKNNLKKFVIVGTRWYSFSIFNMKSKGKGSNLWSNTFASD